MYTNPSFFAMVKFHYSVFLMGIWDFRGIGLERFQTRPAYPYLGGPAMWWKSFKDYSFVLGRAGAFGPLLLGMLTIPNRAFMTWFGTLSPHAQAFGGMAVLAISYMVSWVIVVAIVATVAQPLTFPTSSK